MGEGGAQINLSHHMEGGAKITLSVAGIAGEASDQENEPYPDVSEWIHAELDRILENPLTQRMQTELDKASRDYEILLTQYNQAHLNHLETKDDMDAGNTRLSKLKEQNEHLLKEIESMGKEHEDLITKLNDTSSSSLEENKKIASMQRELEKLRKQHDIEVDEMHEMEEHMSEMERKVHDLETENDKLKEETSHVTLLMQQKEALNGRIMDLQQQVEGMKRNFHSAKKGEEEAIAKRAEIESQFKKMKAEAEGSLNARQKSQNRIAELKAEINRLKAENDQLRAKGTQMQSAPRSAVRGDQDNKIAMLEHELEDVKRDYEEQIARKDRMLQEVKDALKSLGLKLGNLDSKMAIPKLKALLSILTKQVEQYKGRQKELEHLVKSRTTELQYYKDHFGDAVARHQSNRKGRMVGGGAFAD